MLRTFFLISLFFSHLVFLNIGCGQSLNNEKRESDRISEIKESTSVLRTVSLKLISEPESYLPKFKKPYDPTSITVNVLNQRTLISTTVNVDVNTRTAHLELLAGEIYDFSVTAYGGVSGTDLLYSGNLENELINDSTTEIIISLSPQITPPPLILSENFLSETTSKVTLSAEINPNGNYTVAYFEWWISDSVYKNKTKINSLGMQEAPITFSESVNGLSSQTTYYFRVVAESSNNIVFGQEQTFTTRPNIATLSWQPPTTDENGNISTDLLGYKIYYHTDTETTLTVIDVGIRSADTTTGLVTYTISSLASGIHYFYVTAYDTSGNESIPSGEVSKVID